MTARESKIGECAQALHQARHQRRPMAPIRTHFAPDDLEAAYMIQTRNVERLLDQGRKRVGRKIGLTSVAVQQQLSVEQPDMGVLLDNMRYFSGADVPTGCLIQPKVEAEIAFVLAADLPSRTISAEELTTAIAYAAPALEIVDSAIADWDITIIDTIADNASCGLFVLGTDSAVLAEFDRLGCAMRLDKNGVEVSRGRGSACLGDPLQAALWLANFCAQRGEPLVAGDIILSGALGPMITAAPGDYFQAMIGGLGEVTVRFAIESGREAAKASI